jgi:hypothetical protein
LVAGYGELEFGVARCLASALGDSDTAFKTLYRIRGEEQDRRAGVAQEAGSHPISLFRAA